VHIWPRSFLQSYNHKRASCYQIDLIFDRADHVLTVCEIKYTQIETGTEVIEEFEKKLRQFPNPKKKTIEKVLISASGATDALHAKAYFDRIITLENIFMALKLS
jgi:hypothetical protein